MAQFKRIIRWLIRIFFSATVGFAVPLSQMFTLDAFLRGLVIGVGPGHGFGLGLGLGLALALGLGVGLRLGLGLELGLG